ncbi:MAG TPA: acylneuraminate cytidylyltransferase family protein [Candidatus Coproplasma stercoravium]|nr:acylneuraminate cytidylyltransferase family protein [Candidatus Coproplasma stercoravium]
MKIKALVAVRSGSTRVINKNLRPFAGSNLLELKLNQLKRIKLLDGIVVNSNDDEMLAIAKNLGCETVKRDEYYASNTVSMSDVYKNMAENIDTDVIAYINVTNPLILDTTIEKAIKTFIETENRFDSLNSAHLVKEFLFKDNQPINYDLKHQPRSQDLPDIAALNFAINILRKETMIQNKNVVGNKPNIYIIDEVEATDIDNLIDFEFAEFIYNKRKSEQQ